MKMNIKNRDKAVKKTRHMKKIIRIREKEYWHEEDEDGDGR